MNLTLSADAQIIERARAAAEKQGRSLNDLLREQLERLAGMHAGPDAAAEFLELCAAGNGRSGHKFRRADAYDERRS